MTHDDQKALLIQFITNVQITLLEQAPNWPEHWDGIELRWLCEEAFKYEAPDTKNQKSLHRAFLKEYVTRKLY